MKRHIFWLGVGVLVVAITLRGAWMVLQDQEHGLRLSGKNPQGLEEYQNLKDGSILINAPGGTFTMGSDQAYENERPPHKVTLPSYYIGKYPVTNAQFACFSSATGYNAGSGWKEYASRWEDLAPVVCVNWDDAMAYCKWAGLRLPSEQEWELAARGAQGYTYPWGNTWDPSLCQNSVGTSRPDGPARVGSHSSGASSFGCLDMVGSVSQWTESQYDRYPGNTCSDPGFGQWPAVRGCAWNGDSVLFFRGAYRQGLPRHARGNGWGFRCAKSAS